MVTDLKQGRHHSGAPARADAPQSPLAAPTLSKFSVQTFTQPLDHFYNTTDATFQQRFWVNTRHYKPRPGAPVIVIDGGETSGEDRLPFLDTGIADILARATGGIGVVLEHRYYGRICGCSELLDRCPKLNDEQALEDSANFIPNIKFEDIDEVLTAPNTPWIYYGGSYVGARAAYMRVLYPDLVFGAIASSAVTRDVLTNWEYMDVIRLATDPSAPPTS
ncbi:serine carboxypeptidase S28-domain-containing protein [Lactifluus subvellereus]|nr:serine carboxypeptidase S28-domain-containing protein [Lactifluus subvellereus]